MNMKRPLTIITMTAIRRTLCLERKRERERERERQRETERKRERGREREREKGSQHYQTPKSLGVYTIFTHLSPAQPESVCVRFDKCNFKYLFVCVCVSLL